MITISGLTDRQKSIMELLWSCSDIEQVRTLIQSLPTKQDQCDAESLVHIATWETLELEGVLDQFKESADAAIRRCANWL